MSYEKIEKIKEITRKLDSAEEIGGAEDVGRSAEKARIAPNQDHFEALMQQGKRIDNTLVVDATAKPSPMQQVEALGQRLDRLSQADPDTIKSQAKDLIVKLDDLKEQLNTPNLELKGSVQTLLRNKLTHINDSLRIALSKAGVEYVPQQQQTSTTMNPIERFVGYLTQGQYQLQHLTDSVEELQINKRELSPANMLAIQIKVGYIQQEIEFFTSLLNKALESTKTVMNVQV